MARANKYWELKRLKIIIEISGDKIWVYDKTDSFFCVPYLGETPAWVEYFIEMDKLTVKEAEKRGLTPIKKTNIFLLKSLFMV